jgi:hypothetical protein
MIFTNDTILIGFPGMDYDHFHNIESFPEMNVSENVLKKMDESRNRFAKSSKEEKKRWTALKIHPRSGIREVILSVKEIYRNEDFNNDTTLELQYFPVAAKHKLLPQKTVTWYAQWDVVVKDGMAKDERKRGKPTVQPKLSKAASLMVQHMNVYDDDDNNVMPDGSLS